MSMVKKVMVVVLGAFLLVGCSVNKPLFAFHEYEKQMHNFFKGENPEKSISALEFQYRKDEAEKVMSAPGLCAHLGLMYHKVGRDIEAARMFNIEKSQYPESTRYMDQLLSKL